VDGLPANLGVAGGLFVVMLTRYPTQAGVDYSVAAQREQVDGEARPNLIQRAGGTAPVGARF
jgi:hypothetical protein